MIYDIDGNPRSDLEDDLNRFVPKTTLPSGAAYSSPLSSVLWFGLSSSSFCGSSSPDCVTKMGRSTFVTHSIAARDEARSRARELLPDASDEDFRYFRTIHGICYGGLHLYRSNVMQHADYLRFADSACLPFSESFTDEIDEDGLPLGWLHFPGNRLKRGAALRGGGTYQENGFGPVDHRRLRGAGSPSS
jgi:hypothetical protein